jgi:hypothetical protein
VNRGPMLQALRRAYRGHESGAGGVGYSVAKREPDKRREALSERAREALQERARANVRETEIAQEREQEARLEGNKLAAEAAKTLVLVGSGLLVGMAAVVGVLPDSSASSPLLYLAFALVLISIFSGIAWMRDIAWVTMSSEGNPLGGFGHVAATSFVVGMAVFVMYVLWNDPGTGGGPDTPREQLRWAIGALVLAGGTTLAVLLFRTWRGRRRSQESESPPSRSA